MVGKTYSLVARASGAECSRVLFEPRNVGPLVGKWLNTDPYGQHWPPYLGMGNNPVNYVDPDGGFDTKFGAFMYKVFHGGGQIIHDGHKYGVYNTKLGSDTQGAFYNGDYATSWGLENYRADIDVSGNFSVGAQAGEYITRLEGFELNIASFALLNYDFKGQLSLDEGFVINQSKLTPFWEDTKVTQKLGIDVPFIGGSVERSFWMGNSSGTDKAHVEVHGSVPAIGVKNTYDLYSPAKKTTISGGAGIKVILGGDVNYDIGISQKP